MRLHHASLWIPGVLAIALSSLLAMQKSSSLESASALPASSSPVQADSQSDARALPSRTFLLRNVRIFDGTRVISANSVLVKEGRIAQVDINLKANSSVPVLDGTGDTLLPGLVDAHVHSYALAALQQDLLFGVTTELDMEDDPKFAIPIQKEQAEGKARDLADIFTAGWGATCPGGHGTEGDRPVPTISQPEQAQEFVDARLAEGSNYIKIIYEDGSELGGHTPNISTQTMAALVQAAHKRGKLAVVHIFSYKGALDAMNAGADGLAHLFADQPPGPKFGQEIAARHMFVISTLTILEAFGAPSGASLTTDPNLSPYLTNHALASLKNSVAYYLHMPHPLKLEYADAALRELIAAHVPILAGTDAPSPGTWYGASIHRELELLVQGGMKPDQALAAATSVPMRTFRLIDRGRIASGLRADLLLVKGDPTHDIRDTRSIVAIWKLGTVVRRTTLRDTWENALEEGQPRKEKGVILYEVSDLTPKFLKFYEAAQEVDPEQRWQLWRKLYGFAAVPPIPEGQQMARRLLDEAWPRYPQALDRIRGGANGMEPYPRPVLDRVARLLGLDKPLKVRVIAYVGGLENNAFSSGRDGVQIVALPVEMEPAQRALTMPHEFAHAVHTVTAEMSGSWERTIAEVVLQEGLAMRATQAIVPGHPDTDYLTATSDWLTECSNHRTEILAGIEPYLADSKSSTVARFTVGKGASGLGREAYYVGWLVVEALMKRGMTLAQVAHLPQQQILSVVRATVRELRHADQKL